MDSHQLLDDAIRAGAPPGSVIVGKSVSPDGRHAAALVLLPSAGGYLMDELFFLTDDGWESYGGGSGGGISWSRLSGGSGGVLRFANDAPVDADVARVEYEGQEHSVPVEHGHFLFVAWNTDSGSDPRLIGFEPPLGGR
jgi:hypothetical protein